MQRIAEGDIVTVHFPDGTYVENCSVLVWPWAGNNQVQIVTQDNTVVAFDLSAVLHVTRSYQ